MLTSHLKLIPNPSTSVNVRVCSGYRVRGPLSRRGAEASECSASRRPVGTGHTRCSSEAQLLEVRGSVEEEVGVERGLAEGLENREAPGMEERVEGDVRARVEDCRGSDLEGDQGSGLEDQQSSRLDRDRRPNLEGGEGRRLEEGHQARLEGNPSAIVEGAAG